MMKFKKKIWQSASPLICQGALSFFLVLLISEYSNAGQLVGTSQTITNGAAVEAWTLTQNATLIVDGAQTLNVAATQSRLNASGATMQQISAANGSTVTLANTTVNGGSARSGLELINSSAAISGDTTITGSRLGLQAGREVATSTGSTVTVTDSTLRGVTGGARATAFSTLGFSNSTIEGTGAGSFGVGLLSAAATASNNTRIIGDQNGVTFGVESAGPIANQLQLDQSSVESKNGSAILVNSAGATAPASRIDVLNGSTLTGGNGTMLEVSGASNVIMNVVSSDLTGNVDVSGNSTTALTFTQGSLVGNVTAETGSTATLTLQQGSQLTGVLHNVASTTIDAQSRWTLTGNSQVGDLALNGGTVKLGAGNAFYQLDVTNLSGSGRFELNTNFATNQTGFLNVTGIATGDHQLLITSSGNEPASGQPVQVVHTSAGDANFSLANASGVVDLGAFTYGLTQAGTTNDWFLNPTAQGISPSTRAVTALFNTAPTVWYGELTSLRSRMGELRFNTDRSGAWFRAYGNKYNVNDAFGDGYQQTQQGFTLGADAPLPLGDGQWLLGVMGGYSTSDLNLHGGTSGTIKSSYLGTYLTWIDDATGYYLDSVLKINRFKNHSNVGMSDGTRSKGDYDNTGLGGSVEFGRHVKLDDGYFLEPFTQWSAVVIQGKDYSLDNGLLADGDRTRSLLGKAGVTAGRDMQLGNGMQVQPYVRGAMAHEFSKNNEVKVNNNVFNNDLSGSRAELGTGVAINMSKNWQAHVEIEYMNGNNIEMPIGGTVGVQFKW
jgi:outer membrane autotransporter protein